VTDLLLKLGTNMTAVAMKSATDGLLAEIGFSQTGTWGMGSLLSI
jgi:hypothetical protein